jgi:RNA polymerase sigma factor (sigma-70 family)
MKKSEGADTHLRGSRMASPKGYSPRVNRCSLRDAQGQGAEPPASLQSEPGGESASSFEEVYERYFEFVWRSLRVLGVARESLDDAVQDTFGVIVRQLPYFEGRSSLRTWVYGVAQRVAANHRRGHRRKSAFLEPLEHHNLASPEPDAQARAEAREAADAVVSFCSQLDPGRRAVFVLGIVENVPGAEIAALLGIPVNTVYTRVRALRLALREQLEQREVEHD